MGAQGHTTVDFGAFPGTGTAQVSITGQTDIIVSSDAEAWVRAEDSADHSADEHELEDFWVTAKSIGAGVGFTVTVHPESGQCYGTYNVSWVWS